MSDTTPVDPAALREEVKKKYRDVAIKPNDTYHFHTGRPLAARLGYDSTVVDGMPDEAVESFAGVANPFSLAGSQARRARRRSGLGCRLRLFLCRRQGRFDWSRCRHRYDGGDAGKVPKHGPSDGPSAMSSSAKASSKTCPSRMAGPTWSSPTASSTSAPTSNGCLRK